MRQGIITRAGPGIPVLLWAALQISGYTDRGIAAGLLLLAAIWGVAAWVVPGLRRTVRRRRPRVGSAGNVTAVVKPGPLSPTLPQVSYASNGRRHHATELGFEPKAIRFSKPMDRTVRAADLPAFVPCGSGQLVVERFYPIGVVIDEDGTFGDAVAFTAH